MLGEDLAAALPELRAHAESRMTSRATIYRRTGRTAQDETTGRQVPIWDVIHADVPFRLGGSDQGDSASRRQEIAGVEVQTAVRVGHLPSGTAGLSDGDWIDITDGENAGRAFSIVEVEWKDQATDRRVPLLAQNRPQEWP